MENKSKSDISYYLLALLAILLIVLPFFFLDMNGQGVGENLVRLSIHAAAFAGAVLTAGALSTVTVKAMKSPAFLKFGSWGVGAITAVTVTVAAINLNSPVSKVELTAADSSAVDSASVVSVDTFSTQGSSADTILQENETTSDFIEAPKASFEKTKEKIVKSENTVSENKTLEVPHVTAASSDKTRGKECKDEDVGVFFAGQKVNLKEGFGFSNRTKNIRIGDECGCTAASTKVTVVDVNGKSKAEKTVSSPFFTLQSITNLEASDRVTAEVSDLKCANKEGAPTLKKIKKLLINIVFKNDSPETTIRKRAAKELPKQEEINPAQKDKVEEEVLKYGN